MTESSVRVMATLLGQLGEDICDLGASILPSFVDAAKRASLRATFMSTRRSLSPTTATTCGSSNP